MSRRTGPRADRWSLRRTVRRRPEYALAPVGLAAGHAVGGSDLAVFGALFGFFIGKSLTSVLRTMSR